VIVPDHIQKGIKIQQKLRKIKLTIDLIKLNISYNSLAACLTEPPSSSTLGATIVDSRPSAAFKSQSNLHQEDNCCRCPYSHQNEHPSLITRYIRTRPVIDPFENR